MRGLVYLEAGVLAIVCDLVIWCNLGLWFFLVVADDMVNDSKDPMALQIQRVLMESTVQCFETGQTSLRDIQYPSL